MVEIERTRSVDSRCDSYKAFFDYKWQHDLFGVVDETKLQEPTFDLCRTWDSISNSRAMPWIMVECLRASEHKTIEDYVPLDTRKIKILREKLVTRMVAKGEKQRRMFWNHLQEAIEELDAEAEEILNGSRETVATKQEDVWEVLVRNESFHGGLWSSERMAYGAIYYSYESYLRECVRIVRSEPDYRIERMEEFKRDFKDAFGETLCSQCWTDQQINIARLTRHALVHNGGRLTSKLAKQPHNFLIQDDEIQIGAPHTTNLYELLRDRVTLLAKTAASLAEFSEK